MKLRSAGLLAVAAISLGATACGASSTQGTDQQQIVKTFTTFRTALFDGDGKKACDQLSPEGLNEMTTQMSGLGSRETGVAACQSVAQLFGTLIQVGQGKAAPSELCRTSFGALIEAAYRKAGKPGSCQSLMSGPVAQRAAQQLSTQYGGKLGKLEQVSLTDIKVSGDTATANMAGSKAPAKFIKVDGSWKLASQGTLG